MIADPLRRRVEVVPPKTGSFYGQAMTAGHLYVLAGDGRTGPGVSGVPATRAPLNRPLDVVVDGAGNLVIADVGSPTGKLGGLVRVVAERTGTFYGQAMTAGDIYTVAGNGTEGFSGDGGPATEASMDTPAGVALDHAGNLLISDLIDRRVRAVAASTGTFYGQQMTAGNIYTIAGGGTAKHNFGDGGPATRAILGGPEGLTVDPAGNVLIADGTATVRLVAAKTGTFYGQRMTKDDIYSVAGHGAAEFCCDGAPATTAEMNGPATAVTDQGGNIVIADESDNRIRAVAASTATFYGQAMTKGDIYTVPGNGKRGTSTDGTPATQAELRNPQGVQTDQAGNLVIADTQANIIEVVTVKTAAFYGVPMTAGDIYRVAGTGVPRYSGDGGPARSAGMWNPAAVAVDSARNLLIADQEDSRIRVVAATTGTLYGRAMKGR